VISIIPGSALI